ncbi:transporter, major facilitator subfamily protein [Acanthamoeba castellanii str. Neff]|uniref:Transporter, major facilitator subfamily protein n=1 Tax=Acanthamoeba castellanii (strain ATCC 30010 / Neff) TaxID=1257118 RepID=L8GJJ6_ACACF|nr:transporter, major facilitator subfamily protein [Acanthamoeba castellanii str. Neff]ELR13182.1 transporter, major facilitator subfamily protein [Acanthamoeba castellanii str. Neff]
MKWRTADEEEREEQTPLKEARGDPPVPFYSSPPSAKELVVETISTEEQEDPYAKWVPVRQRVLALVALPALLPPITSTMYLPTLNVVIADLETTEEMVAFTLSAYALTVGFCPLAWGPLSDRYGRRGVLLSCLLIFIVAAIIAGSAQHVYTLIGARMLQGIGLSAAGIVGAGSIADVYPPAIRGQAMVRFAALISFFCTRSPQGMVFGHCAPGHRAGTRRGRHYTSRPDTLALADSADPCDRISSATGFVGELLGWRTIFWSLSVAAFILATMAFFFLPDTLNRSGPKKSANPIQVFKLFFHPPITIIAFINASTFSIMFLIMFIFPIQLEKIYGLSEIGIGLSYLPMGIGNCLGTVAGGRAADHGFAKKGTAGRLIPVVVASLLTTIFTVAIGWFLNRNLWITLAASFAFGFLLTFSRPGMTTYGIEQRPQSASSVQACMYSFQWQYSFIVLNFGPVFIERFSVERVFFGLALSVLVLCVPLIVLMCRSVAHYNSTTTAAASSESATKTT